MSNKPKVYNPILHRKGTTEEGVEVEYQEIPESVKSPIGQNSSNDVETFRMKERSPTLGTKGEKEPEVDPDEEKEIDFLFNELRSQKKAHLLKNYTREGLKDMEVRENYFILLCFLSLYGGDDVAVQDLKNKSQKLNAINFLGEKPNQVLRRKEFISMILIAAANQGEEALIKEIIKNDSLGYIVSLQVVLAFLKANMHQILKSLLKVVEASNPLSARGGMSSMIPDNLTNKAALTANNMPKRGRSMKGVDYLEDGSERRKRGGRTRLENGMTIRDMAGSLLQMATLRRPTVVDRDLLPRSAYDNVIIEARFDTVFPHLVQMNRMDLVEPLIEYFGEKHINHLNLFIGFGQEELAMKHYDKYMWELTETQIIMLLERKMWKFLCNITDDVEKMLFFGDQTFSAITEMLHDGKILSELILLFTTLPLRGWKQNQAVVLMELGKNLISEDPETSRLIFANNPILSCAQLSYLLKQLSTKFRFIQNELEVLSQNLEFVAVNLQTDSRENNLYALYLTPLPTGLTMMDYIIRMGMKSLVETQFTKGLVLEFWNDESSVTGSRHHISYISYALNIAKRFGWKINMKPNIENSFVFQFGNTANSPKYLMLMDLFFLMIFFIILDSYIYNKLDFFQKALKIEDYITNLPPYYLDVSYAENSSSTVIQIIFLINYWISFLYRCIHISRQTNGKRAYNAGYYLIFIFLTLTLLFLVFFPSYESQKDNYLFIMIILVMTRCFNIYILLASMLGFQQSGELVTIISTVVQSLAPILCLLVIYILFYSEIMHNFFYDYFLFDTSNESFFTLVEVLFGSLTFANLGDVDGLNTYFAINANLTYFAFSSNLLATFLIIAYLSSILEEVRNDASYQNTLSQYYFLQTFSTIELKGFYSFPPLISGLTLPFLFLHRIPRFTAQVNMFLLKVRFYIAWVPFQLIKYTLLCLFYYFPILYVRNMILIAMDKMTFDGSRVLHLTLWILFGPINLFIYFLIDLKTLLKTLTLNFEISVPQVKLLQRATDDNVIYMDRYGRLKEAINIFMKKNPDFDHVLYQNLLNWLMNGGKEAKDNTKNVTQRQRKPREILAEAVKEIMRQKSSSKWLKNIYAAKKKLFTEILDGFLNYKAVSMRPEEASIEARLALDFLNTLKDDASVSYLRAKNISSLQMVLLNAQNKEQISIMNKIEELDKKVEFINKLWSSHLPKYSKSASLFQVPSPI